MTRAVTFVAHIVRAGYRAYARKWSFLATFGMVFVVLFATLAHTGLLPEPAPDSVADDVGSFGTKVTHAETLPLPNMSGVASVVGATTELSNTAELPVLIDIPSIGLSTKVVNPTSTDINVLDKALEANAVRYPSSASLGEDGNVIIFGHSSYLPVVSNPMYKMFNAIQKLEVGATIIVHSNNKAYIYMVASVEKKNITDGSAIPLNVPSPRLTISTCDSFGKTTDRMVVTAVLVDSRALSAS